MDGGWVTCHNSCVKFFVEELIRRLMENFDWILKKKPWKNTVEWAQQKKDVWNTARCEFCKQISRAHTPIHTSVSRKCHIIFYLSHVNVCVCVCFLHITIILKHVYIVLLSPPPSPLSLLSLSDQVNVWRHSVTLAVHTDKTNF